MASPAPWFGLLAATTAASLLYWALNTWWERWQPAGSRWIRQLRRWAEPIPLPDPAARVAHRLEGLISQSGLPLSSGAFLAVTVACGLAGGWAAGILQSPPLTAAVALTCAGLPYAGLNQRVIARRLAVNRAIGPALMQLAKLADVRGHPYLTLVDAAASMRQPLRQEMERALRDYQANLPLADALRAATVRLGNNHYLRQLAELTDLSVHNGTSYSQSLHRLLNRYQLLEELKAEEQTHMHGYRLLTWCLYIGSLLPVPYWLLRDPNALTAFTQPVAKAMMLWAFLSGLGIVLLPAFFSAEEV